MQAIILAAGMGKRLQELTKHNTKCMVEVNGERLIERMLKILDKKNLERIVIVVGYQRENLVECIGQMGIKTPIVYIVNENYDRTNNIYSLFLAEDYLKSDDTLLFESDLIFEERLVDILLEDERNSLALVDRFESWMDGTCLNIDEDNNITDFIPGKSLNFQKQKEYYKTINIYKFGKKFSNEIYVPFLEAYARAMGNNEYYESVIRLIVMLDKNPLQAKPIGDELWYEIDDIQDLDIASIMFTEDDEERYQKLSSRYGGYWRFPRLMDFCYLVNPYFPPRKMLDEMTANFEVLMTSYPSGLQVNNLLAAKNFHLQTGHVLVGNGAAELIKELLDILEGKVGVIRPTFEEYPNRCQKRFIAYDSAADDFDYSVEKIESYFEEHPVQVLVCINPDNPTGHCWSRPECEELLKWCRERDIYLILDESFADFAAGFVSFLEESILQAHPNLFVIKSISKSYGVPGLRLGILASGNEELLSRLGKQMAIWNINSYAEFFMQIYGKYQSSYKAAVSQIRRDRDEFYLQLCKVEHIKVYPSQANYFMCELTGNMTSRKLVAGMLKRNILIKDLTSKIDNGRQYIRIAVRTKEENEKVSQALQDCMGLSK